MDCKCGKRATLESVVGKVEIYICEHCSRKFSHRELGQASKVEIDRLQNEQLRQIVRNGSYKPVRFETGQVSGLRMYNPVRDREKGFSREYKLKYAKGV